MLIEDQCHIEGWLDLKRDEADKLAACIRIANEQAEAAVTRGDKDEAGQYRQAHEGFMRQSLPIRVEIESLEQTLQTLEVARSTAEHTVRLSGRRITIFAVLESRLRNAETRAPGTALGAAIEAAFSDYDATIAQIQASARDAAIARITARHLADDSVATPIAASHTNPTSPERDSRPMRLPHPEPSVDARVVLMGIGMSVSMILLATASAGGNEPGVQIAAVAAAAVPAIGAAMSTVSRSELVEIANTNLRRTLWAGQLLALLSVTTFVVSVVLGAFGLVPEVGTIYTALTGGALGGVSLIVSNRTKDALSLAIQLEMINSIEDPRERDRVRAEAALRAMDGPPRTRAVGARRRRPTA